MDRSNVGASMPRVWLAALTLATLGCLPSTHVEVAEPAVSDHVPAPPVEPPPEPALAHTPHVRLSWSDGLVIEQLPGSPALILDDRTNVALRGDFDGDGVRDLILDLGACGNWGECIHAILLGCGDDTYAIASEPDLYALRFELRSGSDGRMELWELTRGGSAEHDDLGWRRWVIEDGQARPTEDWQLIQHLPP